MSQVSQSIDHLYRRRAGQMIATLTRIFGLRHLDEVEDAVQDALVQALRQWPFRGMPDNPTAWLVQVAKNRLLDRLRRQGRFEERRAEIERSLAPLDRKSERARFGHELEDDQLRLVFACCHPVIPRAAQVALTLKTVGGFSTAEIARAFLARESTVAQRIVRAKRRLLESGTELSVPAPEALAERLDAVLDVLYSLFNEGYEASTGDALVRVDLCGEAIRLCELLAANGKTAAPRVNALAALFYFQASRLPARSDPAGDLLLLAEQDRSLWDASSIRRGLEHFRESARGKELSTYHLEAEIASCHVLADDFDSTDWQRVVECYNALLERRPTPVVELNRVVALAEARGHAAGLEALAPLLGSQQLTDYYPLHATHGTLLERAGDREGARAAYHRALKLATSVPVRRFLMRRVN